MWWPKPWASDSSSRLCGTLLELQRAAHLEVEAVADQHERDVVERVRVALAQLVGPDDQRVVEQAAAAARLGRLGQPLGQVGELLAVPLVDLRQLLLRLRSLLSGSCDSSWWPSSMPSQRIRAPPTELVILQRGDAGEVGREAVHHQLDLQLADLRHVVVLFLDARLQLAARRGRCRLRRRPSAPAPSRGRTSRAPRAAAVLGADRCC